MCGKSPKISVLKSMLGLKKPSKNTAVGIEPEKPDESDSDNEDAENGKDD